VPRWARCRAPSCWGLSVLWQARSSDTRRDRRSRAPGECSEPRRDPAQRMQHDPALHLNNSRRPRQVRRHRSGLRRSPPRARRCHRFRDLNKCAGGEGGSGGKFRKTGSSLRRYTSLQFVRKVRGEKVRQEGQNPLPTGFEFDAGPTNLLCSAVDMAAKPGRHFVHDWAFVLRACFRARSRDATRSSICFRQASFSSQRCGMPDRP
jgi:hypothetical protein